MRHPAKLSNILDFINSVINEFQKSQDHGDESFMVLTRSLFEITKPFNFVEIPYREVNEIKPHFLKKFHKFTDDGFRVKITWKTSEVQNH